MFNGFSLLRGLSTMPLTQITLDEFVENMLYGVKKEVDLTNARLLDTYTYEVNDIEYLQKVYRLKSGEIHISTENIDDKDSKNLRRELEYAIQREDFERAAQIRNRLKSLK